MRTMTLALALAATSAYPCEPISTVPYTITQSGTYCLDRDLWSPGTAITIHASDVTLDFDGHTLGGIYATGRKPASNVGVLATGENVTVKGGTIRGFLTGVRIARELNPRRGRFARVVQMTILETTKGIELDGRFSVASDNTIERTGLGIIIRHGTAERNTILGASRGIDMRRGVIRDNTLMGVGPVAVSIVYGVCSGNVAQGFATLGCPQ